MVPASGILSRPHSRAAASADELRLAAIDVGSNSIHMAIAHVDADGGVTTLWRMKEMVGLGRRSFPAHRLSAESIERAVLTLRRFVQEAQRRQCEQILAVATSAVRESENGGEFLDRVRREMGLHIRVISARDEARLIYLGVKHAVELGDGSSLIVDVGGGSTEFIVAKDDRPVLLESRKLGASRMTARFVKSDPITSQELDALMAHYDAELTPLVKSIREHNPTRFIGTSGTIENLAAMCADQASSNGAQPGVLHRGQFNRLVGELIGSRSADREKMRGLDDQRKDQIVAGAILVNELFRRLEIKQMEVCRSALREGMLIEYLSRHRPQLQIRREVPDPRRRAVLDLARRCHWHADHSEQVARLTLRLFDQLKRLHGLGRHQRELIEYGALLHDIGSMIGQRGHHKHAMYLILHGDLRPFSPEEVRIIANIARYHRKAMPKRSHKAFAELSEKGQRIVRIGAALLRIADGLDRTNCGVVTDLRCRPGRKLVEISLQCRGDPELEIWSARARAGLFEKVFGRVIEITWREV